MVNNIPLGPNAVSIEVVKVYKDDAYLWRPTAYLFLIGDAINEKIAWPVLKVEIMSADATPTKTAETKASEPKAVVCYLYEVCLFVCVLY